MLKRFDVVLLDADETIFDFKRAEAYSLEQSMEEFGYEFTPERLKLYSEINLACWKAMERGELKSGRLTSLRFEKFFEAMGERIPDCAAFHNSYIHNLADAGFLIDGALEFVEKLHKYCKVYIATNGLTIAQRGRLRRSAIGPYIDGIFISEEIGFQKPTKEYFDTIFNKLGIEDKSRVIMVGDSLTSDMQGGRNAGITTCRYLGDHPHEDSDLVDFEITSYDEFFDILFKN
ncbi:MAG: YjjG family noncanonical pyrimidine nucleotidase [Ruminococcus sp.]|nr:YjjG family noncanonical pyrimidine nucleotidase [Ruminococcus sp.]